MFSMKTYVFEGVVHNEPRLHLCSDHFEHLMKVKPYNLLSYFLKSENKEAF